jgi:hypothetical protein
MLFDASTLAGIQNGSVTLAFRRWAQPRVKPGGTQLTAVGLVRFTAVEKVDTASPADARRAGFDSVEDLLARAAAGDRGDLDLYRITVELAGPDPRVALRERATLDAAESAVLAAKLDRMDHASDRPWTKEYLADIAINPGVAAGELAVHHDIERKAVKLRVRRLKALGLTESLPVGYRLSARGRTYLSLISGSPTEKE